MTQLSCNSHWEEISCILLLYPIRGPTLSNSGIQPEELIFYSLRKRTHVSSIRKIISYHTWGKNSCRVYVQQTLESKWINKFLYPKLRYNARIQQEERPLVSSNKAVTLDPTLEQTSNVRNKLWKQKREKTVKLNMKSKVLYPICGANSGL